MENNKEEVAEITTELINLGMNLTGNSIAYWVDLLIIIKNNKPTNYKLQDIFKTIGEKYGKSGTSIERSLRYGLEEIKDNIKEKYNINKTNLKSVIRLFELRIL